MDFREEKIKQLQVVGEVIHFQTLKEAQKTLTSYWDKFRQEGKEEKLSKIMNHEINGYLGVCIPKPNDKMDYMIAVTSDETLDPFEVMTIPAGNYIVFEAIGPVPRELQKVMNEIHEDFLPKSKYTSRYAPMLEVYPEGDISSDDYVTELWIPVE